MDEVGIKAVESKSYSGGTRVSIVKTQDFGDAARLATVFIERWGMIATKVDGEDSAGRQKVALLTPEEIVERACSTASAALAEFVKRGWMIDVPLPKLDKNDELDMSYTLPLLKGE